MRTIVWSSFFIFRAFSGSEVYNFLFDRQSSTIHYYIFLIRILFFYVALVYSFIIALHYTYEISAGSSIVAIILSSFMILSSKTVHFKPISSISAHKHPILSQNSKVHLGIYLHLYMRQVLSLTTYATTVAKLSRITSSVWNDILRPLFFSDKIIWYY